MADDVVVRTRIVMAALGAGPLILAVLLAAFLPGAPRPLPALSSLAAILGLLAAPAAWRSFRWQRERMVTAPDRSERERLFFQSRLVPAAITEGFALLGGVSYALTREPWALAGIVVHVFLLGAMWPRESSREELGVP